MAENVFSSARVVKEEQNIEKYELSNFGKKVDNQKEETHFVETKLDNTENDIKENKEIKPIKQEEKLAVFDNSEIIGKIEPMYQEFSSLSSKIEQISQSILGIESDIIAKNKELDEQVIKAIKDLKQYANFFEQASFQLENKMIKTSIAIAQKIINIEISENSSKIAKQTISQLLEKIKGATKVRIHLNPKDYIILKKELELESYIELVEDVNVVVGGVVIASNLGNFDGNIEAKISSMLESLDLVI